jgi:acyl-CoA thioester hydrolase
MSVPRLHVRTAKISLRWGDMDALGHVNNTVYFRYFEQVRMEWLFALAESADFDKMRGPVIVNAHANFLVPLVYPMDIEVRMSLGSPGRTSVGSFYDIVSRGKTYADGSAKMVWIEYETGRPTPLPQSVAAPLRALANGGT